jgi:hypothetical protein
MSDVVSPASEVIIDAKNFGAPFQEALAQVRPEKTGAAGDKDAPSAKSSCQNPFLFTSLPSYA